VRVASVVLLVAGAAGGLYLGEGRQARPAGPVDLSFQVQTDEMQLMKARQNEHVAARAWQRANWNRSDHQQDAEDEYAPFDHRMVDKGPQLFAIDHGPDVGSIRHQTRALASRFGCVRFAPPS